DKAIKERGASKPSPIPNDKDQEEGSEKSGQKDNAAVPSPSADKDQAERNEDSTRQNGANRLGPGPNGREKKEGEKTQRTEKNAIEPNEMGRVELDEKKTKNANLGVEVAGPAKIKTTIQLYGKIAMNEDAVVNVSPRFPGVVKTVSVRLGDTVQKGGVLAVVESNDSLRNYQVVSEIAGTIIRKDVTVGEVARDDKPIFTVADLSTVWIDFSVFPQDFKRLKLGQIVHISFTGNTKPITGKIFYISPVGSENTQSLLARAVAQNSEGLLRPGLFVIGDLEVDEVQVGVAVRPAAIQSLNEKTVVFVAEGNAFEAREVHLGIRDDSNVQVVSGISAGDRYVAANSFLLKAELGKGQVGDQD
ncbi:MAG TPA: efflux RND transporter periplasmic adaptor subunit, partial [Chthoniobacterales bacterium]|nr:efflux RND transporter periplasmic adaptor subunit [Chthoniobacterales bacterium]